MVNAPLGEKSLDDARTTETAYPGQMVAMLRDADAMLDAGKELAAVLKALEISEATLAHRPARYGGVMSEWAKRLNVFEEETCQ